MTKSVVMKNSTKTDKKLMAIFTRDGRKKTIHFGAKNMDDYTITKDKAQRQRYLDRHRARENWNKYMSAGSLSRYILWNKPSFSGSYADYRKKFNLKKF